MNLRISRSEARRFKRRWAAVNAAELKELRATPLAQKALLTAALMESAKKLGWMEKLESREEEVRSRWNELKKAAGK
jgi:hypothetical protein